MDPLRLVCRYCTVQWSQVSSYVAHLIHHRHITKVFPCCITSCQEVFKSESHLRTHLYRHHSLPVRLTKEKCTQMSSNPSAKFICTEDSCKKECDSSSGLLSHLKKHIDCGLVVLCPGAGCSKVIKSTNSFAVHMSRYHRGTCCSSANLPDPDPDDVVEAVFNTAVIDPPSDADVSPDVAPALPEVVDDDQAFLENLAQFYMKLEFQYLLPASTVQYIAEELRTLKENTYAAMASKLKSRLSSENFTPHTVECIVNDVFNVHKKHLSILRTGYTRNKFYMKNFPFVRPRKILLQGNDKFFYYVSVLETLEAIVKSNYLISLDAPVQSDPQVLKDFTDGHCFKANNFFKNNKKCLRVIIYQDGFEIVSELGPAKKKHKTLGVYLSLGNLPDYLRSQVNNIFLVALCKEKDYDHEKLFRPIVEDLKILENEGILVPGHGLVKGGLAFIAGDNLGSHCLGGFNTNFSKTRYFCRYCTLDRPSFSSRGGYHLKFPSRTPDNYRECLNGRSIDTRKGVKLDSVFNELNSIHVCGPGLPCCMGHDLFEGIVAHDMALILDYFISNGWFTVEQLNAKIKSFPYDQIDRADRPNPYSFGAEKVGGGAFQIWTFLKLFPLIILDIVDDWDVKWENSVWLCYLLLLEMCELVMAPEAHTSSLLYLDSIIYEYLDLRVKCFPHIPLRPKHHYVTHYVELIVMFGPLSKVWTLRFESKHQFFKRTIRFTKNFINVLKSLSVKHELFQSFLRLGGNVKCEVIPHQDSDFHANMYANEIVNAVQQSGASSFLRECSRIDIRGTTYKKGSLVVVRQAHYQCDVELGRVCLILYESNSKIYFLVEVFSTDFDATTRTFKLREKKGYECILQSGLLTYCIPREYKVAGSCFVKLKHGIYT